MNTIQECKRDTYPCIGSSATRNRRVLKNAPNDFWRMFDKAEILLFSGNYPDSEKWFRKGIETVETDERRDKVITVISPLRDFLAANVLPNELTGNVNSIINVLKSYTTIN